MSTPEQIVFFITMTSLYLSAAVLLLAITVLVMLRLWLRARKDAATALLDKHRAVKAADERANHWRGEYDRIGKELVRKGITVSPPLTPRVPGATVPAYAGTRPADEVPTEVLERVHAGLSTWQHNGQQVTQ
jgi:hypothetical protein